MSIQLENPPTTSESSNRVFISYSWKDRSWVEEYLLRLLKAAGVSFTIDDKDFPLGGYLNESIRKHITECHFTVLVMTEHSAGGKWTTRELQEALALEETGGVERILPIKLRECDVPPEIATRLYLNLCDARKRDSNIKKLLERLEVDKDNIALALNSVARKTLSLLLELMNEQEIVARVAELKQQFIEMQHNNEVLTSYKTLHEDLHEIQRALEQLPRDADQLNGETDEWRNASKSISRVRECVDTLVDRCAAMEIESSELNFAHSLEEFFNLLKEAFQARDADSFSHYLGRAERCADLALPRINCRIIDCARDKGIQTSAEYLQKVYEAITCVDYDEVASKLLSDFRIGIDAMVEFDLSIRDHACDHDILQETDDQLQTLVRGVEPTLREIEGELRIVNKRFEGLRLTSRYQELYAALQELCQSMNDKAIVRDDDFVLRVRDELYEFVHQARRAFRKLDIDLLTSCKKLAPCRVQIQQILERMQDNER